ncbi:MAG: aminoacyl-tRNA hydrolase [Pseudomonadota bacterium]
MKLIVGLGNPGAKYAHNRHNIGFMAVDRIADVHNGTPWSKKFQGVVSTVQFGSTKAILLKPETFMNRSGQSVGEAMRFYKLAVQDVVVVHDELDLAPAKCKVKHGGGHAGHNGLRSIHGHIGDSYSRVRLGIGHPGHKDKVPGYVLRDFAKADANWLDDLMRGITDGAAHLASGDWGRFMNAVSLRTAPPRSSKSAPKADAPKPKTAADKPKNPAKAQPISQTAAQTPPPTKAAPPTPAPAPDTRSPMERLLDKFR